MSNQFDPIALIQSCRVKPGKPKSRNLPVCDMRFGLDKEKSLKSSMHTEYPGKLPAILGK